MYNNNEKQWKKEVVAAGVAVMRKTVKSNKNVKNMYYFSL